MNAKYSTYIGVAILAVVLIVSPVIIFLVRNATNTIQVGIDFKPVFIFLINIDARIFMLSFALNSIV